MDVINNFEHAGTPERMEYVLSNEHGTVRIIHNDLGCGITLNCGECRSTQFGNRDMIGDVDMLGISTNLVGITDCHAETFDLTLVPGCIRIMRPSPEKQSIRIVGGVCDNVSVGYIAGKADLESLGGDPDPRRMLMEVWDRHGGVPSDVWTFPPVHALIILMRLYGEGLSEDRDVGTIRSLASELLHVIRTVPCHHHVPGEMCDADRDRADEACVKLLSERDGFPPVQDIASELGLDVYKLNRIFKARYGATPCAFQRRQRMIRASYLLAYSDLQVGDIAAIVGYGNPSKFSTAFRQEIGCLPRDFRSVHLAAIGRSGRVRPYLHRRAALVQGHIAVYPVHGQETAPSHDIRGMPVRDDHPGRPHHDDPIGELRGDVDVVADHDHAHPLVAGDTPHQRGDVYLGTQVQIGRRLVQQEEIRLLDEPPGQCDLLILARRELRDVPVRQVVHPQRGEGHAGELHVTTVGAPLPAAVPPHQDHVEYGHGGHVPGQGGHVCHTGRYLRPGHPVQIGSAKGHPPHCGLQQAVHAPHEGGLADAIRTDNACQAIVGPYAQIDVPEDRGPAAVLE